MLSGRRLVSSAVRAGEHDACAEWWRGKTIDSAASRESDGVSDGDGDDGSDKSSASSSSTLRRVLRGIEYYTRGCAIAADIVPTAVNAA